MIVLIVAIDQTSQIDDVLVFLYQYVKLLTPGNSLAVEF